MILVLLHLDTIDDSILISHLCNHVGIQGAVLEWFSSYLRDDQWLLILPCSSLMCGPTGFHCRLYALSHPVSAAPWKDHLLTQSSLSLLCWWHSDLPLNYPQCSRCTKLPLSVFRGHWLSQNFLHLNQSKMECIVFGCPDVRDDVVSKCDSLATLQTCCKECGIYYWLRLTLWSRWAFQLHLLTKVSLSLRSADLFLKLSTVLLQCICPIFQRFNNTIELSSPQSSPYWRFPVGIMPSLHPPNCGTPYPLNYILLKTWHFSCPISKLIYWEKLLISSDFVTSFVCVLFHSIRLTLTLFLFFSFFLSFCVLFVSAL